MFIKELRQKHFLSQERLAESSGLSLRTIQRVECGHRVGYSSIRKLAATFDIDVDILERELYAMGNESEEFIETPLWVRLIIGSSWFSAGRKKYEKSESLSVVLAVTCLLGWFSSSILFSSLQLQTLSGFLLITGVLFLLIGYLNTFFLRLGDKYAAWEKIESIEERVLPGWALIVILSSVVVINTFFITKSAEETVSVSGRPQAQTSIPWTLIGQNQENPDIQQYLPRVSSPRLDSKGGFVQRYNLSPGITLVLNAEGTIIETKIQSDRFSSVNANRFDYSLPMGLSWEMSVTEVMQLLADSIELENGPVPNQWGEDRYRIKYLVDGNRLNLDVGETLLTLEYDGESSSDMDAQLLSMSFSLPDRLIPSIN